ncbi:MAG: hypothetical protein J7M12_00185, partial [Candidatus Hydrogenedentes bacterium]|nr:hypothetical protein [Candidatus Hydrogenedentota bacterium]
MGKEKIGRALLLLAAFIVAVMLTFTHVLTSGPNRVSGRYDVYRYYGPESFFMDYSIHNGEIP